MADDSVLYFSRVRLIISFRNDHNIYLDYPAFCKFTPNVRAVMCGAQGCVGIGTIGTLQ